MPEFDRIAIIKTAWCDEYLGELAQGDHANIEEFEESHERYNFKTGPDGRFYAYTPPIGEHESAPSPKDLNNWLVFAVAKRPGKNGIYLVGWYERASFLGKYVPRPEYAESPPTLEKDALGGEFSYTLVSPDAFIIPASQRQFSFPGTHTKRSPVYYLAGNGEEGKWRDDLARNLLAERERVLAGKLVEADSNKLAGGICGDSRRRKEVEEAAVAEVIAELGDAYTHVDRQKDNCGFDILFIEKATGTERHIEIKGTQNPVAHFFLSRNEDATGQVDPAWELALVTDALRDPKIEFMSYKEAERAFDWEVVCWHATRKK